MAEVTKNQWDQLLHKIDEKIEKLAEETQKNLDSKIDNKVENKVNAIALKHFGIRYQWLLVILGVFGLILAGVGIQVTLSLSLMKEIQNLEKDVQYLVLIHKEPVRNLIHNKESFSEPDNRYAI